MLRPSISYLPQSVFQSLLHRKAAIPSLPHSFSSVQTWTPPKWVPRVAHGVLPASCARRASSPSWWLLHPQGLKGNIRPFLFNKMNRLRIIYFISFQNVPTLRMVSLYCFCQFFFLVTVLLLNVIVCLQSRLKTLWRPEGRASELWNFPSALASHTLSFLWALACKPLQLLVSGSC